MKSIRTIIFILTIGFFLSIPVAYLHAQLKTTSKTVVTKVGNAPELPGSGGPAPEPPSDIRQGIIDTFDITLNGFTQEKLLMAWNKFHDISHTKFFNLVGDVTIDVWDQTSEQQGCGAIKLRRGLVNDANQTLFNIILIHELGHVIYWCNDPSVNYMYEHENSFVTDKPLTYYSAVSCYGTSRITEDYAETIAYYLNPGVVDQTACGSYNVVPYGNGRAPAHFDVAKKILGEY